VPTHGSPEVPDESGRQARALMFEAADTLRHGGDAAKTEDVTYYFAGLFEKLGNDF
jgi:hypothetical protein